MYQTPHQRRIIESFGVRADLCGSDVAFYPSSTNRPARQQKNVTNLTRIHQGVRFVYFGRSSREKGLSVAISAFRAIRSGESEFHAYVIDDEDMSELSQLGRHPKVHIHPAVPPDRVVDCMRLYDCLVIPSLWLENFPIVAEQAREAGIGILSSDLPSLRKLQAFRRARWARPGSVLHWARAMQHIIEHGAIPAGPPAIISSGQIRARFSRAIEMLEQYYDNRDIVASASADGRA